MCAENSNADVVVMEPAQNRKRFDVPGPLNRAKTPRYAEIWQHEERPPECRYDAIIYDDCFDLREFSLA